MTAATPARKTGRRLAVVAALLLLYAAFETGRWAAGYSVVTSVAQRQALAARVAALDGEVSGMRQRLAALDVTRKVDVESQSEAQAMIGDLQAELARQQQDLDFYRGLVDEKFGTGTLKVQELAVRPAVDASRQFTVLVTLVHTAARAANASGWLTLAVSGSRGGSLARLKLSELRDDGADRVDFSLRYFTTVEVPLRLPQGFTPASIELEFRSSRGGSPPVTESFPWSGVLDDAERPVLTPEPPAE